MHVVVCEQVDNVAFVFGESMLSIRMHDKPRIRQNFGKGKSAPSGLQ
jgi:hypothetical protein